LPGRASRRVNNSAHAPRSQRRPES
jgi:hypothetical protein